MQRLRTQPLLVVEFHYSHSHPHPLQCMCSHSHDVWGWLFFSLSDIIQIGYWLQYSTQYEYLY